jgi:hypothetical protein
VKGKQKKKKKGGGVGWRGEEADGPLGRRAERGKGEFLFFLFFFFKLFSKQTFPFKFKPKFF